MKSNGKLLKIGIILIGIVFAICIFFIYYFHLEGPVFLKHYYDISVSDNGGSWQAEPIAISYITNITDNRKIVSIFFKEAPDLEFYISQDYPSSNTFQFINQGEILSVGEKIGRYSIRTVYANIHGNNNVNIDMESIENLQLSQAVIQFSDGNTVEVEIGKIVLYKMDQSENYLRSMVSSSSNDGSTSTTYSVKKDIILEQVTSPLMKEAGVAFHLSIGEQDFSEVKDITYNRGTKLCIFGQTDNFEDEVSQFTIFDIKPLLIYRDAIGHQYSQRIYDLRDNQSSHSFLDVVKYLKARGEL